MRRLKTISILAIAAVILMSFAAHSFAADADRQLEEKISEGKLFEAKLFEEGNGYFLSGQFEEAMTIYEKLIKMGYNDPSLFYNLSNAYILLDMPGKAALNLYRARKLQPRSADINRNLNILNKAIESDADMTNAPAGLTKSAQNGSGFKHFIRTFDLMSKDELAASIFILYLLFFTWSLLRKFLRPGILRFLTGTLGAVSYLLSLAFIVILLGTFYYESFYPHTVLMQSVELSSSPSGSEDFKSGIIAQEGSLLELRKKYNGYGEVVLVESGRTGWVELTLIERI